MTPPPSTCQQCGSPLKPGKKFCGACGAVATPSPPPPPAATTPLPPSAPDPAQTAPATPPFPTLPAADQKPGWWQPRLLLAQEMLRAQGLPQVLLPLWLGLGLAVWEAGIAGGLLLRLLSPGGSGRALGELLLASGGLGLTLMAVLGMGGGGAVASLLFVAALVAGLRWLMAGGQPPRRRVAGAFLLSVAAAALVFALVGMGRWPAYTRLGHSHLGFFFSRWTPPAPPPAPPAQKEKKPLPPPTRPKPGASAGPGVDPRQVCGELTQKLRQQQKTLDLLTVRCQTQWRMKNPSLLCRNKLDTLTQEVATLQKDCRTNRCNCPEQ